MAKSSNSGNSLSELKRLNKELMAENAKLKKEMTVKKNSSNSMTGGVLRTAAISILIAIAGAVLLVGNVAFWAGNTVTDTDKFVALTDELIEQPEIQKAIAQYTTESLFDNLDVEQTISNALPEKAGFIASPLTTQLQSATQKSLEKALANDSRFQTLWKNTVRTTHEKFIEIAENYDGNGVITVNNLYENLSKELAGTKLGFLANKSLPPNVGEYKVAEFPALPVAHNAINNLQTYRVVSIIVFLGATLLAILLARNRRKVVIVLSAVIAGVMVASLIAIKITKQSISNEANPDYKDALDKIAEVVTNPLILQTRIILLLALLVIIIAWVSGPYKSAKNARNRIQKVSEGKIHSSIFSKGENKFTKFIGNHKQVLQWTCVSLVALIMIIVELSLSLIIWYALLILALVLIIEILSAPKK